MSYPRLADWGSSKRNLAFSKRTKENSRETSHQTEGWKVGTIVGGWQLGNLGHLDSFFSPRVCKTMHICILYIYICLLLGTEKKHIFLVHVIAFSSPRMHRRYGSPPELCIHTLLGFNFTLMCQEVLETLTFHCLTVIVGTFILFIHTLLV